MIMKNTIIIYITFFLLGIGQISAQKSTLSAGGEATGSGGTSSYSLGQIIYTTDTGSNGSLEQGVQQPYEITPTVGLSISNINLEVSVYPNPTSNYLTLKIEDTDSLNYQLFDIQGKIIENNKINSTSTTIKMKDLSKDTYFLKVSKNNKLVKTFKIIKN